MSQISISELEEILSKAKDKKINLNLKGTITALIQIEFAQVNFTTENIIIENTRNKENLIKINKYQIMKIEEEKGKILIKFDNLQNIELEIM